MCDDEITAEQWGRLYCAQLRFNELLCLMPGRPVTAADFPHVLAVTDIPAPSGPVYPELYP